MTMRMFSAVGLLAMVCAVCAAVPPDAEEAKGKPERLVVPLLPGEGWWGGATTFGQSEPIGIVTNAFKADLRRENFSNQSAPFLLSNKGRYIWCDSAFSIELKDRQLFLESERAPFELVSAGENLREAFLAAAKRHFPASGKTPDLALVAKPQWNTWVELTYNQNQRDILAYAHAIAKNGFPEGGVIMIDDTWQFGYGVWQFDPRRFSDPKAMCDELHAAGYKVMLWVCPFVSMDCPGYREMQFGLKDAGRRCEKGGLIQPDGSDPALDKMAQPAKWWNGVSAHLDLTDPHGQAWFARELKRLQSDYGVDGFKLDAGDVDLYVPPYKTHVPATPTDLCEAYVKIGLQFPLNEYRASWKMAGQPIVQRLCDKGHRWPEVQQLIPDMIACGLLGHPFVCPDMIGSGSWMAFMPDAPRPYDPELFVRSAQVHALAPMMQFSAAPWRMLKGEYFEAVKAAAWTRMKFADRFVELAKKCAVTGEPMLRSLEYAYPGRGWESVHDQFLMGDFLLVAPQVVKGATERTVIIPPGVWKGDDGMIVQGPRKIVVKTPISRLPYYERLETVPCASLSEEAWQACEWISFAGAIAEPDEKVRSEERAAPGTSYFLKRQRNAKDVKKAVWMTSGLGVYEISVNGRKVGEDFLKPGFTHVFKTRRSFTYDVTGLLKCSAGEENVLAAAVSAGWWRDKIVNWAGKRSAFRGVLELTYCDGSVERIGTKAGEWLATENGPVKAASIFEGEIYDARLADPLVDPSAFAGAKAEDSVKNDEFKGVVLPTEGAEVCLRHDLLLKPIEAYTWAGVEGEGKDVYGTIRKLRNFAPGEKPVLKSGETLVVDFGQNCAAIPVFAFRGAEGTTVTVLPAEMLNDAKGEVSRGNDGPAGSVFRANLRIPKTGMKAIYTFGASTGAAVEWKPTFTFFGYRYLSITATGEVAFESIASLPVSSIGKDQELGRLETGDESLNKFISNVYWGQLSNYLSVPTDCPQRNERLGWTADTQVFTEAGAYLADTSKFFLKYTRDLRDNRDEEGGYPSVAPYAQYGNNTFIFGWADAGVIVPWTIWRQFGDTRILAENWESMAGFVRKLDETHYDFEEKRGYIYADWLSYQKFETAGNKYGDWTKWQKDPDARNYRRFLAASYWLYDATLMVEMGKALGRPAGEIEWFKASADRALSHIREKYLEADGLLLKPMRDLQTACVFALKFGIVEGAAKAQTLELLLASIREHGDCLQTGFLGTSFLMEVLARENCFDVAYTLLLQHKNPSWLYSVDQGATTVWERWNSYTKQDGFGPVCMNSFNHYAYGAVLAWIYKYAAGIAADPAAPGFANILMRPHPDKRLGFVKAEYKTANGLVKSAWRYEGEKCIWEFTIPEGSTATVSLPGTAESSTYKAGSYRIEL